MIKKKKTKKVIVTKKKDIANTKDELQRKLIMTKSKIEKLNIQLDDVLRKLEPLEVRKNKLIGDINYFENRVKKLTARLSE